MPQLRLLRLEHCDIATVETSETSTLCVETRQMSVLATADICPVSTAVICPVSTEDIYPVSTEAETAAGLRPASVMSGAAGEIAISSAGGWNFFGWGVEFLRLVQSR